MHGSGAYVVECQIDIPWVIVPSIFPDNGELSGSIATPGNQNIEFLL